MCFANSNKMTAQHFGEMYLWAACVWRVSFSKSKIDPQCQLELIMDAGVKITGLIVIGINVSVGSLLVTMMEIEIS